MNLEKHFKNITNMLTDATFAYGTDFTVRTLKKKTTNPIYYYVFSHVGGFSMGDVCSRPTKELLWSTIKTLLGYPSSNNFGVCHFDDILYLFKLGILIVDALPNEQDKA